MTDDLNAALARSVLDARTRLGLSLAALAETSGVSRAMISRIEREEVQPSAVLLGRLSSALGMTLSELIALAESHEGRLTRLEDQSVWIDREIGYTRRAVAASASSPIELVEVFLEPGAEVSYDADAYRFSDHQVWVIEGSLRLIEGSEIYDLAQGDSLRLEAPQERTFANVSSRRNRYLVVLSKRAPRL